MRDEAKEALEGDQEFTSNNNNVPLFFLLLIINRLGAAVLRVCTAVKKVVLSNLYWRNISVRFLNAQ